MEGLRLAGSASLIAPDLNGLTRRSIEHRFVPDRTFRSSADRNEEDLNDTQMDMAESIRSLVDDLVDGPSEQQCERIMPWGVRLWR